ncbi:SDR family NAD(P)-dependent oxidoreductase [Bombilactobacillus bombi]|uniref:SDR family NAD(P)-dependent oxidoreductase n=1 Tax=Bombilactobacillus bombi TaxID=1303590 RepID=UPI0015E61D7D|nr:SDR family NAD(P)-dependent oxidoreductase [Bombilactobacillus bombi]MBA1434723.1 SDR family NAD(P)-dependent oxidoreductase [Bombilactobacillus bombi]
MNGKTVIVTGASDGIGKAIATQMKEKGYQVVIIGRSPKKTMAVGKELNVPYYVTDFTKLDEVRKLGQALKEKYPKIHILFNNAGGIYGKRVVTVDGFEKTFQINYLAHFLLTQILFDNLVAGHATVINTSSVGNSVLSKLDINDLNMEKKYSNTSAYGNAKLEGILFAKEFTKRYGNSGVSMVAFHPGNVLSNFASEAEGFIHGMYSFALRSKFAQRIFSMIPPDQGADTGVWLATTQPVKDWQPGQYYYKRKIAKPHKLANDSEVARSLWDQSEKMAGVVYPK